jgi:exonuclease SbcD
VVAGNHDSAARLDAVAPLLEMGRVTVVGAPRSPHDGGTIELEDIGVKLALLPFVSQRGIVKAEDIMGSDPDQHAGLFEDRLRRIVESLTGDMTAETVNVLVSHLTVYGGLAGGGERQAHIFGYAIPSSLFPGHLSYVALGHLHRQQKMPHSGAVWYSGSALQLDFGEVSDQKGVLLVEASPGLPAKVTAVPLSEGRRLKTIRGTLDEVLAHSDDVTNAYVKVVLVEKARVGLSDEVRAAIPEVVEVVLESTEPVKREPESRQKLKPTEAFHRYLTEKGVEDPLMESLFAELLEEAAI